MVEGGHTAASPVNVYDAQYHPQLLEEERRLLQQ